MKITANCGKQNKIHILCDGESSFTVDAEFWFSSPYHGINEITDDEELTAFFDAVGSRCAFIAGLRLLSYHDQSEREMINKLIQKGHNREYAVSATEKLKEYGYINDERYAENFADALIRRKGMSAKGIKYELLRKGVSHEIADKTVESLDIDPILRIIDLLNTKYARYLSDAKGIKKTVSALQRLGYSWSDIKSALHHVETEAEVFDDV